ncbi:MAG: response regulator [Verrucomicrobiota bacterium]|jgi:DNA-binding response OmpR family regulator
MKRILIIEDDFFVAGIYENTFKEAGYAVATAYNGEAGLKRIGDFGADLVQVDLMMPKMNGVEIIKQIRASPGLKSLPILVLSSCCDLALVREARQAGASEVISKRECSPKLMLERAEALLGASARPAAAAPSSGPAVSAAVCSPPASAPGMTLPEIRRAFLERSSQTQAELRTQLHALIKNGSSAVQSAALEELYRLVHSLAGQARVTGFVRIAHLASALEVLLRELQEQPKKLTPSILHTLARAVDCLKTLFAEARHPAQDEVSQSTLVLAVDDEPLALHTLGTALAKANLKAVSLDDPELALRVLALNRFDLIFLDAEMPGMDGFEVCKRLRALPTNDTTPVVYVTALSDFEARARATLSGGNDLIAKPFPLSEVAVKALTFLVQARPEPTPASTSRASADRAAAPLECGKTT